MHEVDDVAGIPIIASGWGQTEVDELSSVLKSTVLHQAPLDLCRKDYASRAILIDGNTHLCCYTKQNTTTSICHGDSGGKV